MNRKAFGASFLYWVDFNKVKYTCVHDTTLRDLSVFIIVNAWKMQKLECFGDFLTKSLDLSSQCGTLRTTTRTCSEVMGIQKHVSKRQLLMLLFLENLRHSLHWMRGTTVFYKNLHLRSFITFYSILATNSEYIRMNPEMFTHLFHEFCLLFLV